jgi:hypothetical protein
MYYDYDARMRILYNICTHGIYTEYLNWDLRFIKNWRKILQLQNFEECLLLHSKQFLIVVFVVNFDII